MRISTASVSETMVRQIRELGSQQARLQNQVATGQRIFQPEDDPSAVGRVLNLQTEQRQLGQYARNADRALEIAQVSASGLQGLKKVSDRATEIGTLGGGSAGPAALHAYAAEIDQLAEQALQGANTRLGNDHLFGGTAVASAPFLATRDAAGRIISVTYAGDAAAAAIPLSAHSSVSPTTGGATNAALAEFLGHLVSLRDALNQNNPAAVATAQTGLLATEDQLVAAIAENGGVQTRIEAAQSTQKDLAVSLESLISQETDADLPSTIVKLNQTQTAYQAALQSAASIMKISLLDYLH
jgi:flagellar hook-associated protein 3 FlgL